MRNPCRRCIVRATCSDQCKESNQYINKASEVVTFFGFVIGIIIITPIFFYLGAEVDKGNEWAHMTMTMIYIISYIIVIVIQAPMNKDQRIGFFGIVFFGPFLAIVYIVFYIAKPYCRTYCKTRRSY